MLDFQQAMRDQDSVEELCSRTFCRREPFSYNESYGFDRILKEYSGYPLESPIQAVVPHGIYLNALEMLDTERDSGLPAVLNYPAFRSRIWEQETDKVVVPSASPFLYALSMFRNHFPERSDAQGTIFVPGHSIPFIRPNVRWSELADELMALDEALQPVTVCMHRQDIAYGSHEAFARKKMRVVCAGNGADPEFVYRWLHLVSTHRYAASNDVGGAVIYATEAGLEVQVIGRVVDCLLDPALRVLQRTERTAQAGETKRRLVEMFRDTSDGAAVDRAEVARYLLGAQNMKTPSELKAELEYVATLADAS